MKTRLLTPLLALAVASATSQAALVTWGAPTNIAGDSDVSTAGTLVGAINLGSTGVTSPTVNTVAFTGLAVSGSSVTSGNFNLAFAPGSGLGDNSTGSGFAPFASLSAPYRGLLGTAGFASGGSSVTLTMSSLTVGASYQFQFWTSYSGFIDVGGLTTATAGSAVSLSPQATLNEGGLGQFALGTFTANAATQAITFTGTNPFIGPQINGFQLRQLAPPAVPEPGTALAGVMLAGLVGLRRRRMAAAV